jgi:hypothetical protein
MPARVTRRWVHRHDLAGYQRIKRVADSGELLLDAAAIAHAPAVRLIPRHAAAARPQAMPPARLAVPRNSAATRE